MDRKQLKAQSKNLIRTAQPKPVVTAIIYLLILSYAVFCLKEKNRDTNHASVNIHSRVGMNRRPETSPIN